MQGSTVCLNCQRFHFKNLKAVTCDSYPEGIPPELFLMRDHTEPFPGDDGLIYLPTEGISADVNEEGKVEVAGEPLAPWPDDLPVSLDEDDLDLALLWWRDFAPDNAGGMLGAASEGETALD